MHLVGAFPGHDPTGDGDGDQVSTRLTRDSRPLITTGEEAVEELDKGVPHLVDAGGMDNQRTETKPT